VIYWAILAGPVHVWPSFKRRYSSTCPWVRRIISQPKILSVGRCLLRAAPYTRQEPRLRPTLPRSTLAKNPLEMWQTGTRYDPELHARSRHCRAEGSSKRERSEPISPSSRGAILGPAPRSCRSRFFPRDIGAELSAKAGSAFYVTEKGNIVINQSYFVQRICGENLVLFNAWLAGRGYQPKSLWAHTMIIAMTIIGALMASNRPSAPSLIS
jgi:hypothetical protein